MLETLAPRFEKSMLVTFDRACSSDTRLTIEPRRNPTGILSKLGLNALKKTIDRYLHFPSARKLAVSAATPILHRLIDADLQDGFDVCVLQTTPPHDMSLLGLRLKNIFPSIRWLVDWQDLWTFDESYRNRVPRLYRKRLMRLEKTVLDSCDLNIATNSKAADVLHSRYDVPRERLTHISHPYWPDEQAEIQCALADSTAEASGRRPTVIGFLGRLSKPPKVPSDRVLKAMTHAVNQNVDLEFHIFGDKSAATRNQVQELKCDSIVLHERAPHMKALLDIARCDFLLVSLADLPNCRVIMHAKLPHYLMLRKPIIAMVPADSFVAELVHRTRSGVVIDTDSDWGAELVDLVRTYEKGEFVFDPDEAEIARYSWDSISEKWIDAIVGG